MKDKINKKKEKGNAHEFSISFCILAQKTHLTTKFQHTICLTLIQLQTTNCNVKDCEVLMRLSDPAVSILLVPYVNCLLPLCFTVWIHHLCVFVHTSFFQIFPVHSGHPFTMKQLPKIISTNSFCCWI